MRGAAPLPGTACAGRAVCGRRPLTGSACWGSGREEVPWASGEEAPSWPGGAGGPTDLPGGPRALGHALAAGVLRDRPSAPAQAAGAPVSRWPATDTGRAPRAPPLPAWWPWLWGAHVCRKSCRPGPGSPVWPVGCPWGASCWSMLCAPHQQDLRPGGQPPTSASPPVGTAFTQTVGENPYTLASGCSRSCERWTILRGPGGTGHFGRQEGSRGWAGRPVHPAGLGREKRVPQGRACPRAAAPVASAGAQRCLPCTLLAGGPASRSGAVGRDARACEH